MSQGRTIRSLRACCAVLLGLCTLAVALARTEARAADSPDRPQVVIDTTLGPITVELDRSRAPITVDNFLKYVDAGYYDGTVFHRVIPDFMIQGGGLTEQLDEKPGARPPIRNESGNGLSNLRGTIAMARTSNPHSATSQFFINLVDNTNLDNYGGGYTVFGKVTDAGSMKVVDAIARIPTTRKNTPNGPMENVPAQPIVIKSVRRKPAS